MNGAHDMGGAMGFGPVPIEPDEPPTASDGGKPAKRGKATQTAQTTPRAEPEICPAAR